MIKRNGAQFPGKVILLNISSEVVGIEISFSFAQQRPGQAMGGVAKMIRHLYPIAGTHLGQGFVDGCFGTIALGGGSQIYDRFRQGDAGFGKTYIIDRSCGRCGYGKCLGISQADIFSCMNNQAADYVAGILTPSSITAIQYRAASGSEPRILLMKADMVSK